MVSQSDHTQTLAIRGATSVVGTASTTGRNHHSHHHHHSSSSSTRSRRYNRSHTGGTSYIPQNEFPWFSQSGDVEIVVRVDSGHENKYLLHRHTLTRCSGFFEASTSDAWSRAREVPGLPAPGGGRRTGAAGSPGTALASTNDNGGELARIGETSGGEQEVSGQRSQALMPSRKRWRYELDRGSGSNDIPMLVQKEETVGDGITTNGFAVSPPTKSLFGGGGAVTKSNMSSSRRSNHGQSASHSFFRSVTNLGLSHTSTSSYGQQQSQQPSTAPTQAEQDLLRDYDNLFRIMYNYPPILDGVNIADAYVQCKSLLTIADQYDALGVAGSRVDHHLLQFQSRLWKQIAKYPISYLRLGYLARSRIIYQEALIHVVGQWPAGERSLRAALPETVLEIIEDKVDELEETVSRVEGRLFRLNLCTRSGERVTPQTGYLDWLAVSLFRQWIADATSPAPPSLPPIANERRSITGSARDGGGVGHYHPSSSSSRSSRNGGGGGGSASGQVAMVPLSSSSSSSSAHPPLPGPAFPSLGRTFRTIGSGINYLGHDECKRFLKLTPELYSRDNLRRFEKRIDELKGMAREIVRPLVGSGLELDLGPSGSGGGPGTSKSGIEAIAYLTCTRVLDRDMPWSIDD